MSWQKPYLSILEGIEQLVFRLAILFLAVIGAVKLIMTELGW